MRPISAGTDTDVAQSATISSCASFEIPYADTGVAGESSVMKPDDPAP